MRKIKEPDTEPFFKSVDDFLEGKTIEELIMDRFIPYYGLTEQEIISRLKIEPPLGKNRSYFIAKSILGLKRPKIEEFEKADILFKTIRLENTGTPKRSIQFSQIQFKEIVNEIWEESIWYYTLTHRYFFVIFQKNNRKELVLRKVMFWTTPYKDLKIAEKFWKDTRKKIQNDDYMHFIKASNNMVCHVGNVPGLMKTPSGKLEKKKCYCLNASYLKQIIN